MGDVARLLSRRTLARGRFSNPGGLSRAVWDVAFVRRDANDLLAQIGIWQRGDISRCAAFGGDLDRALAAIKAHILLMPGQTDRYFDVRDNEAELGTSSMPVRPSCIPFHRSTATVPEIPSTIPQTAPSSTPKSRRCCSAGSSRRTIATMSTAITATGEKLLSPTDLRSLSVRSNLPGIVRATSHYGAIVAFGALIWLVSSQYGLLWAMPLMVVQGYFVAFLFMVVHETAHKTAFRNRALNLAFGHLSSFAIGLPYEYYCLFHWDHHRYTQDPARDPELLVGPVPASDTQLAIAYSGIRQVAFRLGLMLRHGLTGSATAPWIPEAKRHIVVKEARLYLPVRCAAARLACACIRRSCSGSGSCRWSSANCSCAPISTPNTPAATGREAPSRTPGPPIPACSRNGSRGTCPTMSSTTPIPRSRFTRCRS